MFSLVLRQFEEQRSLYEYYGKKLEILLRDLLKNAGVEFSVLEWRVKDTASLQMKLEDKIYTDPLRQITDFCGLRVIAYDLDAVTDVSEIIKRDFEVDPDNSMDKSIELSDDQFGYHSIHFIVGISPQRLLLPEYEPLAGLKAEIQVRTVAQHAWASISHKLRYKNPEDLPRELARELNGCAAILERVDTDFQTIIRHLAKHKKKIAESLAQGELELPVSFDSLEGYIGISRMLGIISKKATALRYAPGEPEDAEISERRLSGAVKMCHFLNISTLKDLDAYLSASNIWATEWLRDLKRIGGRKLPKGIAPSASRLSVLRHMLVGHMNPSLSADQLAKCACRNTATENLVAARSESLAGRPLLQRHTN